MRATLLVLALVAVGLAGCTDTAPAPVEPESTSVVTDPTDYSYIDNETDGSGWHVHDYWKGGDELQVLDHRKQPGGVSSYGGDKGAPIAGFHPDAGDVVPQGAASVTVTATWDADPESSFGTVSLYVKTAKDDEAQLIGPIEKNTPITFNSTNEANDPPHQTLSLWRFELWAAPREGEDSTLLSGASARIEAVAHKGLEIPAWPPHPDFWNGATELTLFEDEGGGAGVDVGMVATHSCISTCTLRTVRPDDGLLVPFDATRVDFLVTKEPAQPVALDMAFHGADAWEMQTADPAEEELTHVLWSIPVDRQRGDSPYALQSLWQFDLGPRTIEDMYVHLLAGDLAIKVTAHK